MALEIFITLLLVLMNGFFVAAEFAIVKVRASQLEVKIQSGNRFAVLAKHISSRLDNYLAATQLGITLASLGLGWIGEPVVSVLIINLMHLLGIDVRPELALKILGINAVHGTEVHSSDELKYLVQQSSETGAIKIGNYNIIQNAFDFSERTARQIMVPRTQVLTIEVNDFSEAILEKVIEENYSRVPCYEDNLDNIIGVVYLKDILMKMRKHETINIRDVIRTVMIIPETKHIGQLLKDFQVKHQQIAIVVDEYGSTKGIITMEDILEELVGQIQDEYDTEIPVVQKTGDKVYTVAATALLNDVNDLLPHSIETGEGYTTIAGKLIEMFGRIPNTNDKIVFDDYEFVVLKKNKNSILLVQLYDLKK